MGSAADIVSDGAKTVIANGRDCHGGHDWGHHSRRDRCDDDGTFHLLRGQANLSHETGESGRFTDANNARILLAIQQLGEGDAARALAIAKNISDSEARTAAAFALTNKNIDDNGRAIIKEINDNEKALDAKLFLLQGKQCESEKEVLKTSFENTIRIMDRISDFCGPRHRSGCDEHGRGVVISK